MKPKGPRLAAILRPRRGAARGDAPVPAPRLRGHLAQRADGGHGRDGPSVDAALGDKRTLFLEGFGRCLSGPVTSEAVIDGAATAREAAWGLLRAAAEGFEGARTPRGCLLATGAIGVSAAADVHAALAAIRLEIEARLRDRIVRGAEAGEVPAGTDADALAGHAMATIRGLSTLARDGADRDKPLRVAAVAMAAWPDPAP